MEYIRYHPLIDCDTDGVEKVPMFFCADEDTVRKSHSMYLVECIPHTYRLVATNAHTAEEALAYKIHCPACGQIMTPISGVFDNNKLQLLVCKKCNPSRH